ncbi:Maf family nucleotide pyrophosphatase [Bifidobacterium asteroides]|uniref:Maf family nucleotide pyrophosphatase n=1 Tax=Bifidobacterium asteroides TaxID=1684 RepID=UPI0018DE010D|nr:septum formation protein Maf [Bifidobacterium asteroides]
MNTEDRHIPLILASSSPSRRRLLVQAGIDPIIRPSKVDEPAVLAEQAGKSGRHLDDLDACERVGVLAEAKASAVQATMDAVKDAERRSRGELVTFRPLNQSDSGASSRNPMSQVLGAWGGMIDAERGPLLLGCDSLFSMNGVVMGKPHKPERALERLMAMRGRTGTLVTGHCLIDLATGHRARAVSSAQVIFGDYDRATMQAYVATGEPLEVAGSFTLEGLGSAFIQGVEGDPSGVMGLSMPTLRALAQELGVSWSDLWAERVMPERQSADGSTHGPEGLAAPAENVHQPGDGWVDCACGKRHWGLNGAAGVLLARRDVRSGAPVSVLLQHRARWSAEGGTWGVPGGAISDGENPLEGGLRESYEEANIRPEDIQVVGSYLEDHGPWGYTTILAFERPGHHVDPRMNDDESIALEWVDLDKVSGLPLLKAFGQDWPHFRQRLETLAAEG